MDKDTYGDTHDTIYVLQRAFLIWERSLVNCNKFTPLKDLSWYTLRSWIHDISTMKNDIYFDYHDTCLAIYELVTLRNPLEQGWILTQEGIQREGTHINPLFITYTSHTSSSKVMLLLYFNKK